MAEKWFNIADEKLLTYLNSLDGSLTGASISYMIYGGVATQAHIARYLTAIHGRDLLDLATSGDIDLSNYMRSTNNVDIAFGLIQDDSHIQRIQDLKGQDEESAKKYEKTRKLLSKGKKGALDEFDRQESERKDRFSNSIRAIEEERKILRDERFNLILDSFVDTELKSFTEGSPITMKQVRRGSNKLIYTLGEYGHQNDREPLTVHLCRDARNVSRNGCLSELDVELYSNFLFGAAEKVKIPYMDTEVSLRVMTPEDLLITKILMWRPNDKEDAQRLVRYAVESGNQIDYDAVEDVLLKEKEIRYNEDGKEKTVKIRNPVLNERYNTFRKFIGLK